MAKKVAMIILQEQYPGPKHYKKEGQAQETQINGDHGI